MALTARDIRAAERGPYNSPTTADAEDGPKNSLDPVSVVERIRVAEKRIVEIEDTVHQATERLEQVLIGLTGPLPGEPRADTKNPTSCGAIDSLQDQISSVGEAVARLNRLVNRL